MDSNSLIEMLRAAGEPRRLEILLRLSDRPATGSEMLADVPVSQPNLSRHLKVLREAGLIEEERRGRSVRYAILPGDFVRVMLALLGRAVPEAPEPPALPRRGATERRGREVRDTGVTAPARGTGAPAPEPGEPSRRDDFEEWLL